jgi:hypothetical protein
VPQVPNGYYTVGFWCKWCGPPKADFFTSAFPGQRWSGRRHYTILRVTEPRPPLSEAVPATPTAGSGSKSPVWSEGEGRAARRGRRAGQTHGTPAPRARAKRQTCADPRDPGCARREGQAWRRTRSARAQGLVRPGLGQTEQAQPSVSALDESTPYAERTPEERALLRGVLMQRMIEAE